MKFFRKRPLWVSAALRAANERRPPEEAPAFSSHSELVDAFSREAKRAAKELEGVPYEDRELFEREHRMMRIAALERYLNDEPVLARAPTLAYRMGKFVRRHQGGVLGAALTLLALVSATAITAWQMVEANRQRDIAILMLGLGLRVGLP